MSNDNELQTVTASDTDTAQDDFSHLQLGISIETLQDSYEALQLNALKQITTQSLREKLKTALITTNPNIEYDFDVVIDRDADYATKRVAALMADGIYERIVFGSYRNNINEARSQEFQAYHEYAIITSSNWPYYSDYGSNDHNRSKLLARLKPDVFKRLRPEVSEAQPPALEQQQVVVEQPEPATGWFSRFRGKQREPIIIDHTPEDVIEESPIDPRHLELLNSFNDAADVIQEYAPKIQGLDLGDGLSNLTTLMSLVEDALSLPPLEIRLGPLMDEKQSFVLLSERIRKFGIANDLLKEKVGETLTQEDISETARLFNNVCTSVENARVQGLSKLTLEGRLDGEIIELRQNHSARHAIFFPQKP